METPQAIQKRPTHLAPGAFERAVALVRRIQGLVAEEHLTEARHSGHIIPGTVDGDTSVECLTTVRDPVLCVICCAGTTLADVLFVQCTTVSVCTHTVQVGIMFEENSKDRHVMITDVLFGGCIPPRPCLASAPSVSCARVTTHALLWCARNRPAYMSKQISKGDFILRVDGVELHSSDNILTAIEGNQIPGTTVKLLIKKADTVSSSVRCQLSRFAWKTILKSNLPCSVLMR